MREWQMREGLALGGERRRQEWGIGWVWYSDEERGAAWVWRRRVGLREGKIEGQTSARTVRRSLA